MSIDLSLVLACYNEEDHFDDSVAQIIEVLDSTRFSYEIIFVDDCSHDRTRELIDAAIARYSNKRMRRLFHEHNKGRGGTVSDGFRMSIGEIVGFIDIDLETHARYIPSCVMAIRNGADIATGWRIYRFNWRSLDRHIMSRGYAWLMRTLLNVNLKDTETGYKFFRRSTVMSLLDSVQDERWFWDTEIMVRAYLRGDKIVEIPTVFMRRFDKRSTVNNVRDTLDYLVKLWRFRAVVAQIRKDQMALNPQLPVSPPLTSSLPGKGGGEVGVKG
jgi:glycosyltransferase involved in cell wall biosynthesis